MKYLISIAIAAIYCQSPTMDAIKSGKSFQLQHPTTGQLISSSPSSTQLEGSPLAELTLARGSPAVFVLSTSDNTYNIEEGWAAIKDINSTNFVRHSSGIVWESALNVGQSLDYAYKVEQMSEFGFQINTPFENSALGYDQSQDRVVLAAPSTALSVQWNVIVRTPIIDAVLAGQKFKIQHPSTGQTWSYCADGTISLTTGEAISFEVFNENIYNPKEGWYALQDASTDMYVSNSAGIAKEASFGAADPAFAMNIMATADDTFIIANPSDNGLVAGFDSATGNVIFVAGDDGKAVKWTVVQCEGDEETPETEDLHFEPFSAATSSCSATPSASPMDPYYETLPEISTPCESSTAIALPTASPSAGTTPDYGDADFPIATETPEHVPVDIVIPAESPAATSCDSSTPAETPANNPQDSYQISPDNSQDAPEKSPDYSQGSNQDAPDVTQDSQNLPNYSPEGTQPAPDYSQDGSQTMPHSQEGTQPAPDYSQDESQTMPHSQDTPQTSQPDAYGISDFTSPILSGASSKEATLFLVIASIMLVL